jgi:osmoprotectant transport system permease protein
MADAHAPGQRRSTPRCASRRCTLAGAALLAACLLAASLLAPAAAAERLRVGSKRFTESYVLAWILALQADPARPADVRAGLGNTAIVYAALRAGTIDLYPEYLGTIEREILGAEGGASLESIRARLAPLGLGVAIPFGFSNGYALAMRERDAERLGIRTLSDLAAHPALRPGLSNEFLGRTDGWPGLARRYALPQRPVGLEHALGYAALADGRIDLMDVYTTDPKIAELDLRVLADDLGHFPRYDAVVLHRLDAPARAPAEWSRLQRLAGTIDERTMIAMNGRAEREGVAFEAVARDFLRSLREPAGPVGAAGPRAGFVDRLLGPDLARLTLQHVGLVLASVAAAVAIGLPLAVALAGRPRARGIALAAVGVLQTVPSLALLALLVAFTGTIGALPAVIALTLYALLPIVGNAIAGLSGVPDELRSAADALALTRRQRLRLVELPLAMPMLLAGLRTATVISVGTATIAAFVGAGGYGERIVTGLALNDASLMLAGAVPSAVLAVVVDRALGHLERRARAWQEPAPR